MNQQEKIIAFAKDAAKEIVKAFTVNPSSSRVVPIAGTMLRLEIKEKGMEADGQITYYDGKVSEWFPKQEALQEIAQQLAQTKIPGWAQEVYLVGMQINIKMMEVLESEEITALQTILEAIGKKCDVLVTPIRMPEVHLRYFDSDNITPLIKIQISASPSAPSAMHAYLSPAQLKADRLRVAQQRIGDLMHHLGWQSNSGWEYSHGQTENVFAWVNPSIPNWTQVVSPANNVMSQMGHHPHFLPRPQYPGMSPVRCPHPQPDFMKNAGMWHGQQVPHPYPVQGSKHLDHDIRMESMSRWVNGVEYRIADAIRKAGMAEGRTIPWSMKTVKWAGDILNALGEQPMAEEVIILPTDGFLIISFDSRKNRPLFYRVREWLGAVLQHQLIDVNPSVIVVDESEGDTVQLKVSLEKDSGQNTGSAKT